MKPRNSVIAAVAHREVRPVPFWLGFQPGITARLNEHFGNEDWQDAFRDKYLVGCDPVGMSDREPLPDDPAHLRDYFGSIWRIDGLADHLERPALAGLPPERLSAPDPARLRDAARLERCRTFILEQQRRGRYVGAAVFGKGLYENIWNLWGFEDALANAAGDTSSSQPRPSATKHRWRTPWPCSMRSPIRRTSHDRTPIHDRTCIWSRRGKQKEPGRVGGLRGPLPGADRRGTRAGHSRVPGRMAADAIAGRLRAGHRGRAGCVLDEWWNCMQAQPRFGVPTLYQLSGVERIGDIPDWMRERLRDIWNDYLAERTDLNR